MLRQMHNYLRINYFKIVRGLFCNGAKDIFEVTGACYNVVDYVTQWHNARVLISPKYKHRTQLDVTNGFL